MRLFLFLMIFFTVEYVHTKQQQKKYEKYHFDKIMYYLSCCIYYFKYIFPDCF